MFVTFTQNANLNLLKRRTQWSQTFGTTVTDSVVGSYRNWYKQANVSPLIRGDHKKPNPYEMSISYRKNGLLAATYFLILQKDANGNPTGTALDQYYGGPYSNIYEGLALDGHSDRLAMVQDQANRQFLDRLRGGLDVSVDLAQWKKTTALGVDVRNSTRQIKEAFMKVGWKRITAPMKAAGNLLLFFNYGVKPTLQTIFDGINEYADPKLGTIKTVMGKGLEGYRKTGVLSPRWPDSTFERNSYELEGSYRCKVWADVKIPPGSAGDVARWSSLNPMSIAWELLPWSFVADWFFNVGDYLRSVESRFIYGRYIENMWRSTSFIINHKASASRSGGDVPDSIWTGNYAVSGWDKYFKREFLPEIPAISFPKYMPDLGSTRMLNAAALLTTFLRR